ncbi:MAG: carbamoyl phosphate synthase large subunit, partial [Eubacteriales bacterium]|nr:carbamoyl phosphate synthase large subunit [Eubacteriales bacterium]
ISMAKAATEIIMMRYKNGNTRDYIKTLKTGVIPHYGVKEAIFPFNMFHEVDPVLGPEMRSTGEVLGMASSFGLAFFKAQEATQVPLPSSGSVLISVADQDKKAVLDIAARFIRLGFEIYATEGTDRFLKENGIASVYIKKVYEGRPNIADAIMNKQLSLVINTPAGRLSKTDDSYIRKAAIKYKIPYITTIAAAAASVSGIEAHRVALLPSDSKVDGVMSLQEYHSNIFRAP